MEGRPVRRSGKRPGDVTLPAAQVRRMLQVLAKAEAEVAAVKYCLAMSEVVSTRSPRVVSGMAQAIEGGGTPCGRRYAQKIGGTPCVKEFDAAIKL